MATSMFCSLLITSRIRIPYLAATCLMNKSIVFSQCLVYYTNIRMKHYDPKFRRLRARKVIKIPLPDYDEMRREEKLSAEEIRAKLKEKGIAPPRRWNEKPIFISCTGGVIESYVPPEGDGKISVISPQGVKQKYEVFEKKSKSYMALRKIRNFEFDFDVPSMAEKAHGIYLQAHEALAMKDEDKLHEFATEKCFQEMMENVKNKTLHWKYIQSLELPRVVHIRCQELLAKNNLFAQATVRFHSQQVLAIYDRFGRLMHGGEDSIKDVLEYVVFEKHLSNPNSIWRLHAKILPDWMPPRDNILKTFYKPNVIDDMFENSEETTDKNSKSSIELSPSTIS